MALLVATASRFRKSLTIGAFLTLLFVGGCQPRQYSAHYFSFPPQSQPESGWQYLLKVTSSTEAKGSEYRKSEKDVSIVIEDRQKRRLLDDRLRFNCASIESSATWGKFEEIQVDLVEVGNEYRGSEARHNDPYSVALARSGPRQFAHLLYRFDATAKVFKRVR